MKNLIQLREQAGLRQIDVAKEIGLSRQAYCSYENDKREPDLATLCKLADFFEVSIDYLLGRTPSEFSLTASHAPEYEKIIESQSPERKKRMTEIIKILADMSDTQLENTLGFFGAAQSYNSIKKDKSIF